MSQRMRGPCRSKTWARSNALVVDEKPAQNSVRPEDGMLAYCLFLDFLCFCLFVFFVCEGTKDWPSRLEVGRRVALQISRIS